MIAWLTLAVLMAATPLTLQDLPPQDLPEQQTSLTPKSVACAQDDAFDEFIKELHYSARHKNLARLLLITSNDVHNRFPFDAPGTASFIEAWYLQQSTAKSRLWPTLLKIVRRPCVEYDHGRVIDDGEEGGFYLIANKVQGRWIMTHLTGNPD